MLYSKYISILLCGLILSACAAPLLPAESSAPESSSAVSREDPTPSPDAELRADPMIYLYNPETELYEQQPFSGQPATVADLVFAAAGAAGSPVRLREVTQQKGMVVVDFEADSPPVIGMGSSAEITLLNSAAMTILRNHRSAEWICYRAGGEGYSSGHMLFEIDEPYPVAPLRLVSETDDAYAAIRARIPFPGLSVPFDGVEMPAPFIDDATSRELAQALWMIGPPDGDAPSPSALDPAFILEQAIMVSPLLDCSPYTSLDSPNVYTVLEPIAAAVEDEQMVLREHVEAAARALYGDTVSLVHQDVFKWKWHETEGVYTPPHMGGGTWLPVLFAYEQTGDRYRVECTFIAAGPGGYFSDQGDLIDETNQNKIFQTRSKRREFVLERQPDGNFRFVSHKFLA